MPPRELPPDQMLEMLESAPSRIATAAEMLTPAQLHTAPGAGEWSVNDVLAHLRACADVWGGAIARILSEDHPTIRAIDPRNYMVQTNYPDLRFHESFQAFSEQRLELLQTLGPLSAADWQRDATLTGAGRPLNYTVTKYVRRIVLHERAHLKQIERSAQTVSDQ
jgi:uncharacterized damage-inducible protein DinB